LQLLAAALDIFARAFNRIACSQRQRNGGTGECDNFAYHDISFLSELFGVTATRKADVMPNRI
jgi:hypothetical protein